MLYNLAVDKIKGQQNLTFNDKVFQVIPKSVPPYNDRLLVIEVSESAVLWFF